MINENLIPKTETVYELKSEIPSYEEFAKNYEKDEKVSKVYEIEGESYEERGYGPCSVCSKSIQWTDLWVGCPVSWCSDKSPGYWYHARCGSSTRMEISNRGKLRCKNCYATYQVGCWNFSCSEHGGTPESITPSSFRRALAVVLNWPDDCDEVIIDLSTYIADPKHRNEWFN